MNHRIKLLVAYRHTLLRSEALDGEDCYVIESVPATEQIKKTGIFEEVCDRLGHKQPTALSGKAHPMPAAGESVR